MSYFLYVGTLQVWSHQQLVQLHHDVPAPVLTALTHEGQVHPTLPSHPAYLYHNFQGTMYLYTSVSFQNFMVNQVDSKLLSTNTAVPCLWMLSSPAPGSLFFLPPNPTAPLVCTAATHIALWLLLSYNSGICPLAKNCFPDLGHCVCLSGGFSDTISSWTLGLPLELFPSCLVCKVCLFHTSH